MEAAGRFIGGRLRVGIVWQGNPKFGSDSRRSTRFSYFDLLSRLEGVRLFSLQRGTGAEQIEDPSITFDVVTFTGIEEQSDGFLRTAAILKNLDLVISVDTGVAHLAGAMGLPTWLLLPFANDWRWLVDREDTPWYPTMRLFRQKKAGDWSDVFARVADALRQRLEQPSVGQSAAGAPIAPNASNSSARLAKRRPTANSTNARHLLEQAAALDPTDWRPFHDIGVVHAQQKEFATATGFFRRAISLAPSVPVPYANLGLAFLDNEQVNEGIAHFHSAIRLGGGSAEVHFNLGRALRLHARLRRRGIELSHRSPTPAELPRGSTSSGEGAAKPRKVRPGVARVRVARSRQHRPSIQPAVRPTLGGRPPSRETILIHAEQHLGDTDHLFAIRTAIEGGRSETAAAMPARPAAARPDVPIPGPGSHPR